MNQMQEHFQLATELLRLERQAEENKAALRQAKYDLREVKVAQAEYSGSFKSLRDKFTGRKEASETTLRHAVQQAELDLTSAQRQKEALDTRITEVKAQLTNLPDWQSLSDGSPEWYRLEGLYCLEALEPLLNATHELLVERRNQFNGANAGQLKTRYDLADIYSAPEAAGEACKPYIQRLKTALDAMEIPFELSSFLDAPTYFLSSATQYTRMDRINTAIGQVQALSNRLPDLQKQLTE